MPISCHFRDRKALLVMSLTHVSGAITGVQTFISLGRLFQADGAASVKQRLEPGSTNGNNRLTFKVVIR